MTDMRFTGWILIAVVGLALFGFAMFDIGQSQHKEQPSQQRTYSNSRRDEAHQQDAANWAEQEKHNRRGFTGFLKAINEYSGALLAAFTAVLAFATWLLWLATCDL